MEPAELVAAVLALPVAEREALLERLRASLAPRPDAPGADGSEDAARVRDELTRLLRFTESLLAAVPTPVFYKDAEGRYLGCNRAFTEVMGVSTEDLRGKTVHECWPSEHAEVYHQRDLDLMRHPAHQVYEFRVRDQHGAERPVIYAKDVFRDERDRVAGIVGAFIDIGDRVRAEEALRRRLAFEHFVLGLSRTLLGPLPDQTEAAIDAALAALATHLDMERACLRQRRGTPPAFAVRYAWTRPGSGLEPAWTCDLSVLEGSALFAAARQGEVVLVPEVGALPAGSPERAMLEAGGVRALVLVPLRAGDRVLGFLSLDSTRHEHAFGAEDRDLLGVVGELFASALERQRFFERHVEAQRLEAIGRLAAGLAHDVNNLLTPILGYADLLLGAPDDRAQVAETARQVEEAAIRARDLVARLLAYSRGQVLALQVLDLRDVAGGLAPVLRQALGEGIALEIHAAPAVCPVRADRGQLEQVLLNLAVNARDAMPEGGRLVVETALVELDEAVCAERAPLQELAPGRYARLTVTDTGSGMDEPTRIQAFEPFFSTKPRGEGTGLGLATVYGIVKQHGGAVWLYSEVGRGTTFRIHLPLVDEPLSPRPAPATPRPARHLPVGATVLVVEDDDVVRTLVQTLLERAGLRVLVAESLAAARAVARACPEPIGLLVSDVVLPDGNGPVLFSDLAAAHPQWNLKVLYMSGYTPNVIAHHGVLEVGAAFVQKPFTRDTFLAQVARLLG